MSITRAAWREREIFCPMCRQWENEVQRTWDDQGNYIEDRCLKCGIKYPYPRRKPGNLFWPNKGGEKQ